MLMLDLGPYVVLLALNPVSFNFGWLPEFLLRRHDLAQMVIYPNDFITFVPQDPCQVFTCLIDFVSFGTFLRLVISVKLGLTQ